MGANVDYSQSRVSVVDGNPIISITETDFREAAEIHELRDLLAGEYGPSLTQTLGNKLKTSAEPGYEIGFALVSELMNDEKGDISTHFEVVQDNGRRSEFALSLYPYLPKGSSLAEMQSKLKAKSSAANTWIALDPDVFYLDDDDDGNELWPVTFEAVNLADASNVIDVTFDKNGYVSHTSNQSKAKMLDDPNILFVSTSPVLCVEDPFNPCPDDPGGNPGGGGGSSSGGRVNDWSRGESTGEYSPDGVHFTIKSLKLAVDGDGGGHAELQLFSRMNDDFQHNFAAGYKYRFDRHPIRDNPITDVYDLSNHTIISGSDGGGGLNRYYSTPDVNSQGVTYSFEDMTMWTKGTFPDPLKYKDKQVDGGFPLFNVTIVAGPWRIVLVDDDRDYDRMSTRRNNTRVHDVWFRNLADDAYQLVNTGFTTNSHLYGSSDDVLLDSGVRQITLTNAQNRMVGSSVEVSRQSTEGGEFLYLFGLRNEWSFYQQYYP